MDSTDQNMLDLSALAPEPAKLKLPNGKVVDFQPPSMKTMVQLSFLGDRLSKSKDSSIVDIKDLVDKIYSEIEKVIPEIKNVNLSTEQLQGLLKYLQEVGSSSTNKIMKEAEIKVEDDSPKAEA